MHRACVSEAARASPLPECPRNRSWRLQWVLEILLASDQCSLCALYGILSLPGKCMVQGPLFRPARSELVAPQAHGCAWTAHHIHSLFTAAIAVHPSAGARPLLTCTGTNIYYCESVDVKPVISLLRELVLPKRSTYESARDGVNVWGSRSHR